MHVNLLRFTGWIAAAILTCAYSALGGDWPTWRYDSQRRGASPDALPPRLHLQWVLVLPPPRPAWPPDQDKLQFDRSYEPVVLGKTIFVPSMVSDRVTAYDTETGEEKWRFYTDGPVRFAPVAANGKVYFTSDDGYLYCLDAERGSLLWKFRGGPSDRRVLGNKRLISTWPARGAPVLFDGTIYFAAGIWPFMGIFIHALEADTGQLVWTNSGSGSRYLKQQHNSDAFAGVAPQGYMAATEDKLLVSGGRTVPAAYDRRTGKFLYFHVSERRAFGKDAGGYAVAADKSWFLVHDRAGLYRLDDGEPVCRVPGSILADDAVISVGENGRLLAHTLRPETEQFVDRKGKTQTRYSLPKRWETSLEPALDRIFIKAGPRAYGRGNNGLIAAVDLPQPKRPARVSWQTRIEGDAWSMIAADDRLFVVTRQGRLYCFGAQATRPVKHELTPAKAGEGSRATRSANNRWAATADNLLEQTGVTAGYCLVLGAGDGRLIEELARRSGLILIVFDPSADTVEALRRKLDEEHLYGTRIAVHVGDIHSVQLPPYLANLIVSLGANGQGRHKDRAFVERVYRCLRPYGGLACFARSAGSNPEELAELVKQAGLVNAEVTAGGAWTLLKRAGALPGSADWTHQYADAANSVVSQDKLVKAPLGLLWFGGSSNTTILPRHGHGPSPQVTGGRLFIEGPDLIRAVDVYTGRVLWEKALPGIGRYYNYTSHEPGANAIGSNYVSLPDGIYVAYGKKCLRLDPVTGATVTEFQLPAAAGKQTVPEWGYIGVWQDVLVGGAQPISFWEPELEHEELDELRKKGAKRLKALAAAVGAFKDFSVIEKKDGESDTDFIVKNFNKLLNEPDMAAKIPPAVKAGRRDDKDWSEKVTRLHIQIRQLRQDVSTPDDMKLKELKRALLEHYYPLPHKRKPEPGRFGVERIASKRLIGMNRHNGEVLWTLDARHGFRHNTIALGGGRVFCIDRLPEPVVSLLERRGQMASSEARLVALDARTGELLWDNTKDVFGTWLSYSKELDVLVQAGSRAKDRLHDEVGKRMAAYRAADGHRLWKNNRNYAGPVMLHHDTMITQGEALDLKTGKEKTCRHPLTGRMVPWRFDRNHGCNTAIGSEHLITFRSAAAGYYDLANDGGTGNLGGFKSGCTSNLIVADGVLNAPDYTYTCTCSYQNQTSLAVVHDPEADLWTFSAFKPDDASVRRVGINFGAPGDRLAENGTLWLDYPSVGGKSPDIEVVTAPKNPEWFRSHPSRIRGGVLNWVTASGAANVRGVTLKLAKGESRTRRYDIRLYFAEPEPLAPGQRVFDIALQGQRVLEDFDIAREAGGPNRGLVKEFQDVKVADTLTLTLSPSASASHSRPILCGLEVIAAGIGPP